MTPAVKAAERARVAFRLHEYEHDTRADSYGLEAAEALGLDGQRVFKTLLVELDGDPRRLAVAIVPVIAQLNLKAMARHQASKKAAMTPPEQAERATGYLVGGISPLGQKRRWPTVIDTSAGSFETIFVSAGRRGLEIELAPDVLCRLTGGSYAEIAAGQRATTQPG
jgi:Cys-tRNA(Pro)/Cys-tRNA(Cys) deacylase